MYLSTAFLEDKKSWEVLKDALEGFGHEAGLFDEIAVRPLGMRGGEPFQIQVRKRGRRVKGPARNLIDVGYGVSQVLPVLTELFRACCSSRRYICIRARKQRSEVCSAGSRAGSANS